MVPLALVLTAFAIFVTASMAATRKSSEKRKNDTEMIELTAENECRKIALEAYLADSKRPRFLGKRFNTFIYGPRAIKSNDMSIREN